MAKAIFEEAVKTLRKSDKLAASWKPDVVELDDSDMEDAEVKKMEDEVITKDVVEEVQGVKKEKNVIVIDDGEADIEVVYLD